MATENERPNFSRAEVSAFDEALELLVKQTRRGASADAKTLLFAALNSISSSIVLSSREQDRRASLVLSAITIDNTIQRHVAILASQLVPSVRNAIARTILPEYRKLAFSAQREDSNSGLPQKEVTPLPAIENSNASCVVDEVDLVGQVLLVGTAQEHEHNIRLLDEKGIYFIRAKTPDEVSTLLTDDSIGVVIARSLWTSLTPAKHEEFLDRICRFSSFAFIKIDSTGYGDPANFDRICSLARCRSDGQSARNGPCHTAISPSGAPMAVV